MQPSPSRRVVVTGLGAITSIGLSADAFWDSLVAGRSGIVPITFFDSSIYPCKLAGEVHGFEPGNYMDRKDARRMARFSQFGVAAAREAITDAALNLDSEDRDRIGVVLGNGNAGMPTSEESSRMLERGQGLRLSPFVAPMMLANMAASHITMEFGITGYSTTIITACAAGTQAVGEAAELIRRGTLDVVVTGGAEATICELGLAGFCSLRALSTKSNDQPEKASRPFDAERDGFIAGEGAGILILESLEHAQARGAHILAEVAGYGASADAFHIVAPDEKGTGAIKAMRWALQDAGISPAEVDYINAHGTSTPLNDATETTAIKTLFGEAAGSVAISSTKSMIGHLLGAAGGVEAVATVKTIITGLMHPTINQEHPDPACDLDYVPNVARARDVRYAMSNSFGFGGQNA